MRPLPLLLAAAALSTLALMAAAAPPPLDLIVLAGQSNMAGRGGVQGLPGAAAPAPAAGSPPESLAAMMEAGRAVPRAWDGLVPPGDAPPPNTTIMLWSFAGGAGGGEWVPAKEPLFVGAEREGKVAGVGPGLPFAIALAARNASAAAIGLVPTAEGGSALAEWEAGGALAARSADRVRAALAAAPAGSSVRAVLWYQGETDALDAAAAATYADRLAPALAALRKEAGGDATPIVAVAVVAAPPLVARFNAADGVAAVRAATLDLPARMARAAVVDAASVGPAFMPDGVHLTADAQVRLGAALAAALDGVERAGPERTR